MCPDQTSLSVQDQNNCRGRVNRPHAKAPHEPLIRRSGSDLRTLPRPNWLRSSLSAPRTSLIERPRGPQDSHFCPILINLARIGGGRLPLPQSSHSWGRIFLWEKYRGRCSRCPSPSLSLCAPNFCESPTPPPPLSSPFAHASTHIRPLNPSAASDHPRYCN